MKATTYRPDGFHTVTPYFLVKDASQFIDFLKRAFDATEIARFEDKGAIRHAEVRIGDSVVELSEAQPEWPARTFAIHLYVEDCDSVFQRAIAAGAKQLRAVTDQFYGDREGDVEDPFGNQWFIATRKESLSHEEMMARMPQPQTK